VIIVMGTVRVEADAIETLKPAMAAMVHASRAEDGCLTYAYGWDVLEPGLIRVSEAWESQAALDAHLLTPHLPVWRAALQAAGVRDRDIRRYEAVEGTNF
jgi:quinol monooxygenase YgiN